jgi:hypothetical protein
LGSPAKAMGTTLTRIRPSPSPFFDQGLEFDEHGFPFLYCVSPVND